MDENAKFILETWKKAVQKNNTALKKLCEKYGVEEKPVKMEEYFCVYRFKKTGIEFIVPYDPDAESYNLTGDALKFAEEHYTILGNAYYDVDKKLEKAGFFEVDSDEHYKVWEKDDKNYSVTHFAESEKDIDIDDA